MLHVAGVQADRLEVAPAEVREDVGAVERGDRRAAVYGRRRSPTHPPTCGGIRSTGGTAPGGGSPAYRCVALEQVPTEVGTAGRAGGSGRSPPTRSARRRRSTGRRSRGRRSSATGCAGRRPRSRGVRPRRRRRGCPRDRVRLRPRWGWARSAASCRGACRATAVALRVAAAAAVAEPDVEVRRRARTRDRRRCGCRRAGPRTSTSRREAATARSPCIAYPTDPRVPVDVRVVHVEVAPVG